MPVSYPTFRQSAIEFSGGPIATLGAIAAPGSGYSDGNYPNTPLTGGSGRGALANITVTGGAVTAVILTDPGAHVTASGAMGYLPGDQLSVGALGTGVGSGFAIPVATVANSYAWVVPIGLSTAMLDGAGAGGGGGAGQATSGAGGGGGGSGSAYMSYPISLTPGATLTFSPGLPGIGGVVIGAVATAGGASTLTGTPATLNQLGGGLPGNPGVGGTGGTGGNGSVVDQGNGGAAGVNGTSAANNIPFYRGGSGGGGGGSTGGLAGIGGGFGPYQGNSPGQGNGAGGSGGKTPWGRGGVGGAGLPTPVAGDKPASGLVRRRRWRRRAEQSRRQRRPRLAQVAVLMLTLSSGPPPPISTPFLTPQVHISAGQSWRGIIQPGFTIASMGWNSQTQTLLTLGMLHPFYPSGVLNTAAGVGLPNNAVLAPMRGYRPDMFFPIPGASTIDTANAVTMGRTAVLAQQLLRLRSGHFLTPIIEYTMMCPSSSWVSSPSNDCAGLGPGGHPWDNMLTINAAIQQFLPDRGLRLNPAVFRSVGWTQGGSFDHSTPQPTIDEFTDMTLAYDALALPGTDTEPLFFYVGIRAPNSADVVCTNAEVGTWEFTRANANGRTVGTAPWYQWKFNGNDSIHTGIYGVMREGEFEGLAKYVTEDEGTFFTPLWRSFALPITRSGQVVTVPFDRAAGSLFATAPMVWMSEPEDGLEVWPQYGFHVWRGGVELTVTPTISNMNVLLTIAETINPGDALEVSYAFYGPGGPTINDRTGVGGNLTMLGPPSDLFPGKFINSWAWPFIETVTA